MHFFIYYIIFFFLNPQLYVNIKQKNQYIEEFNAYISVNDYKQAVRIFEKMDAIHRLYSPQFRVDVAHAYFMMGDTAKSGEIYRFVKDTPDPELAAVAENQLGLLALAEGDTARGIRNFIEAVKKDQNLKEARFNYELAYKLYKPKASPTGGLVEAPQQVVSGEEREDELSEIEIENISKERALQLLDNLRREEAKALISKKASRGLIEKDW